MSQRNVVPVVATVFFFSLKKTETEVHNTPIMISLLLLQRRKAKKEKEETTPFSFSPCSHVGIRGNLLHYFGGSSNDCGVCDTEIRDFC